MPGARIGSLMIESTLWRGSSNVWGSSRRAGRNGESPDRATRSTEFRLCRIGPAFRSAVKKRATARATVVLPLPDSPTIETVDPSGTSNVTPSTARNASLRTRAVGNDEILHLHGRERRRHVWQAGGSRARRRTRCVLDEPSRVVVHRRLQHIGDVTLFDDRSQLSTITGSDRIARPRRPCRG